MGACEWVIYVNGSATRDIYCVLIGGKCPLPDTEFAPLYDDNSGLVTRSSSCDNPRLKDGTGYVELSSGLLILQMCHISRMLINDGVAQTYSRRGRLIQKHPCLNNPPGTHAHLWSLASVMHSNLRTLPCWTYTPHDLYYLLIRWCQLHVSG